MQQSSPETIPDGLSPKHRSDVRRRIRIFASALSERGIDAAVILEPENIRYLTGFETLGWFTPTAAIVRRDGSTAIYCRQFELANVGRTAVDSEGIGYGDDDDPITGLSKVLRAQGALGWDYGYIAWTLRSMTRLLQEVSASPADVGEVSASPADVGLLVYEMRMVKSEVELAFLRQAATITHTAHRAVQEIAAAAQSEREVVAAAYGALVENGAAYPSSPVYLASGPRSSLPHATWDPVAPLDRNVLFVEMGAAVQRYTAPLMRTGLGQGASARLRRLGEAVDHMLDAALAAVAPGARAGTVDITARNVAAELGVADALHHRVGYSVGVSFPHGWGEPHVLALRSEEDRPLQPGMVFHLVPHLYDAAEGSVGASATVAVTSDGHEVITSLTPRLFDY